MNTFIGTFINSLYSLANLVIDGVSVVLKPFSLADYLTAAFAEFGDFLGAINYFVPFGIMIDIASAWIAAISTWYIVQFVLRFIQLGD